MKASGKDFANVTDAIAEHLDASIRRRMRAALRRAPAVLDREPSEPWTHTPGSPADEAVLLRSGPWSWIVASTVEDGLDLPLTQAGHLLDEAAAGLSLVGDLQIRDPRQRAAGVASVARTASEKSVVVAWTFSTTSPDRRLARAALIEITGLEQMERFLRARGDDWHVEEVKREREQVVHAIEEALGEHALQFGSKGGIGKVLDQEVTGRTKMFEDVLGARLAGFGSGGYGEQSVWAHPTGHRQMITGGSRTRAEPRQVVYPPRSSFHDEGRVLEVALGAYAQAVGLIGDYLGQALRPRVAALLNECSDLWHEWCTENGCRSDEHPALLDED